MASYAKFMIDLVTKKRWMNFETIKVTQQVSAIVHSMAPNLVNSDAFTIPCTIRSADFAKALCDFGASINLIPYSMFKTLGIGKPRPTYMRLQMADGTMKRPLGVIEDVLVRVVKFILPADFVIHYCKVDYEVTIILGRNFLDTGKALYDVDAGELIFRVDLVTDVIVDDTSSTINVSDMLEIILLNFDDDEMDGFMECVDYTLAVLQRRKKAIGWTLADIRCISAAFCMHKIKLEDGAKLPIEHQRRLNESMQEVVKMEIIKWLDTEVVYPISANSWTFRFNVSQRRGTRCYSGFNQILIVPEDQEKTTFICPYGTFSFKRMPFGLCNVPTTFQRCMMAIFMDIVEDYLEVFMDYFSVVGDSFDDFLANLDKGVRSFLGHAEFYQKFIKDFSKVVNPLCKLLEKDAKFHFNDDCMRDYEQFKLKLTTTHIIISPNWSLPFALMCDASNVAVGAILGQRINKNFHPVYYASKTMNSFQVNYIVMEKELLAIVFAIANFRPHLMGARANVHTDHAALRYLMRKKESKARLMRYVLLLQEFDIDIQDKKENGVTRRCVPYEEESDILWSCHSSPYGGSSWWIKNDGKVLICGFYWPTLYKNANNLVEVVSLSNNEARSVVAFLKRNILTRFGTPRAIISDEGSYFCNEAFDTLLGKYGVTHKVITHYHPQASGQVKVFNREIKSILSKTVNANRSNWSKKIDDALWAYRMTYKTPIRMSLYWLVFVKACHLPLELEHKAMWDLEKLNLDWDVAAKLRVTHLNKLDEFQYNAYESSSLYKEKMKYLHDK
ncbi:uncharacterized protein [Nicotiana tomentosiformis]|uniref:uncharacterized protein n=1 Tax=Nicotiana tomentosiformis TaxID=4098 RepID=UPI00388CA0CF